SKYWRERFELLEDTLHEDVMQIMPDIDRIYKQAQADIEKEIRAWYQRLADNNGVSMTEARKLLAADELKEFRWSVEEYIKRGEENAIDQRWMKQLENASARVHISRLEALKLHVQQSVESVYGNQLDQLDESMRKLYQDGYYRTAYELQKGFEIGWPIAAVDQNKLDKIIAKPWAPDGKNFSDRVWSNRTKLVNELHAELSRMCITGASPDRAIKNIAKKMNTSRANAGRLVMTEAAYFGSASQKDCFNDLGVERYEICATLDSHTSDICQEMDGKVFDMKDYEAGGTAPPFHVYCRSCTCPYFEDEFTAGEMQAARREDGKTYYVSAGMKYPEWKKQFTENGPKQWKNSENGSIIKNIDDCSTTHEVQELMKRQGWFNVQKIDGKVYDTNKEINLEGVDVNIAKEIFKTHKRLFDKFPQLKGKLNSIVSKELEPGTYAQCYFGTGRGGIEVNLKYFKDAETLQKMYEKDLKSGFHPEGTNGNDIVMHELGHAIDDYLTNIELLNGWQAKTVSSMLRPKVMQACELKISDIKTEVSGYATKDAAEWFAECFAEWMCSDHVRTVAAEFGKQLEELMKEVK
ncbi:MAG: minor capsid protein, partial [Clostridiales Family XIII bacterium]|nr:minor capsid protein [Clostridiales Family XIII bacterium]